VGQTLYPHAKVASLGSNFLLHAWFSVNDYFDENVKSSSGNQKSIIFLDEGQDNICKK
jgi:hypothetical protein